MDILKVKEALAGTTLGKGRMYNPVTQLRCAVGQLAHHIGIPDTTQAMEPLSANNWIKLREAYDFKVGEIGHIMEINDNLYPKRTRIKGDDILKALIG